MIENTVKNNFHASFMDLLHKMYEKLIAGFQISLIRHSGNVFTRPVIIPGSFRQNLRYLSFYASDSDVIRVTGYLVKKSEIEKLEQGQNVKHDTTALGLGAKQNGHIMERKVR